MLAVSFIPGTQQFLAGNSDGVVSIYDVNTVISRTVDTTTRTTVVDDDDEVDVSPASVALATFPENYSSAFSSCTVNSSRNFVLLTGKLNELWLYDLNTLQCIDKFGMMHKEHVNVIKFTHNSPSVFGTASFDRGVCLWDLRTRVAQGVRAREFAKSIISRELAQPEQYAAVYAHVLDHHGADVCGAASNIDILSSGIVPAGNRIEEAIHQRLGLTIPFGVPRNMPVWRSQAQRPCILGAFSHDDAYYLASGNDNMVEEYDVGSGQRIHVLDVPRTYTPDCYTRSYYMGTHSEHIITGSNEGVIRVYDSDNVSVSRAHVIVRARWYEI